MLTAANKTTKQAQEIVATAPGGLLVSQEECRCYRVPASDTLPTGPCRLVGVILVSSTEASTVTIESNTESILKLRSPAGWSQSAFLPLPAACADDLAVTLTGANSEALLYVAESSR